MSDGPPKRGPRPEPAEETNEEEASKRLLPPLGDRVGPAHRRTLQASDAMVQSVVQAALVAQEQGLQVDALTERLKQLEASVEEVPPVSPRVRARSPRRVLMLAAASFVLLSAGALAAVVVARVVFDIGRDPVQASPRALASEVPAAPAEEATAAEALEVEPVVTEVDVSRADKAPTRVRKTLRRRTQASPKAPVAKAVALEGVDLASAPPEDLFALANRLRRRREWLAADEVYGAVVARVPGTDAAVVAEIASATLHVEQLHDARGALEGYRRALRARPTGALAEDARWGLAEAFRALGDDRGELRALRDFLERHPDSALAPAAHRRLSELAP